MCCCGGISIPKADLLGVGIGDADVGDFHKL